MKNTSKKEEEKRPCQKIQDLNWGETLRVENRHFRGKTFYIASRRGVFSRRVLLTLHTTALRFFEFPHLLNGVTVSIKL